MIDDFTVKMDENEIKRYLKLKKEQMMHSIAYALRDMRLEDYLNIKDKSK